jgi:hypothetical protein
MQQIQEISIKKGRHSLLALWAPSSVHLVTGGIMSGNSAKEKFFPALKNEENYILIEFWKGLKAIFGAFLI